MERFRISPKSLSAKWGEMASRPTKSASEAMFRIGSKLPWAETLIIIICIVMQPYYYYSKLPQCPSL